MRANTIPAAYAHGRDRFQCANSDAFGTYGGYPNPDPLDLSIAIRGANSDPHAAQVIPYAEAR
jgi:hypothetical protein